MQKQKVTLRDVARSANVSASAVSLVLNDRPGVSAETRARVWRAAAALGYTIRSPGESERPPAVGLLIERSSMPVILDIFYGEAIAGFQAEAQRLGAQVVLRMFDRNAEKLDSLLGSMAGQVRGLVIANDGDSTPEMVRALDGLDLPLVLLEGYSSGRQIPCVLGDNFTAGYTVMRHLLDLGHRALAVLPGPAKYSSLLDRQRGALAAAAAAGLLIPPHWMPQPQLDHPKQGYMQMKEILRAPSLPTAILAVSDKTAFAALEALKEADLRIPEDIALAGIDDVPECVYSQPPLTSYRVPKYQMGVLTMQLLQRLIGGAAETPMKSVVYGELIVRQSSGARLVEARQ